MKASAATAGKQTVSDGVLPVATRDAFHTIEYRHIGSPKGVPGTAPVLVFLHEGLGCVTAWHSFPTDLCQRCQLPGFVYSRLGYGGSSPASLPRSPRYLHDEALDLLPAVLDAAGIERCILVGHSDGASIALIFAGSHHAADRVQGLCLIAPHVFNEPACVAGVTQAQAAWEAGWLRAALLRHHGAQVDAAFSGWRDVWLSPRFRRWNIEASLGAIGQPVLLLQGEKDEYGTVAQLDAIEAGVASVVTRPPLLTGAGHAPFRDQPATILGAFSAFLASIVENASTKDRAVGPAEQTGR